MSLEIDGLLRGRDMGYSVRHPDHSYLDEFCCCEERHCHLPGETPKERHHYASLMIAAPEMYELIQTVARTWEDDCQFIISDTEAASALSGRLARLAGQAAQLLDKIEGGEA